MIEAAFWGGLGASALLIGAVLAFLFDVPKHVQGLILAFGAGTLIGAVAYELFEEAVEISVSGIDVAIGFGLGATVFYLGSLGIDRLSPEKSPTAWRRSATRGRAASRSCSARCSTGSRSRSSSACRCSAGEGVSVAVLAAVFISNIPEGLSASEDLADAGLQRHAHPRPVGPCRRR